jgi:hypothetical protein
MISKELAAIFTFPSNVFGSASSRRRNPSGQNRAKQLRDLFYLMRESLEFSLEGPYTSYSMLMAISPD